jgi:DNA-binding CsgD family transcriptional regulator
MERIASVMAGGRRRDGVGGGLCDRQSELELLRQVLDHARSGEGSLTLVEGPAGIGKTRLLRETRAVGRSAGLRTLSARCAALERDFAYGVVRQLFDPALRSVSDPEQASLLDGPAEGAVALLGGSASPSRPTQAWQPNAIMTNLNALYWLTSNLAEREPLLLMVDDCHWSDGASLRFLEFLTRRIDELPVALLLAVRWTDAGEAAEWLAPMATEAATHRLRLQPLGDDAVDSFVAAGLAEPPEATFVAACRSVTGGNPFLLGELVAEVRERGIPPTAARVDDVLRLGPPSVARALELRLARMPRDAGALAGAIAILGDTADTAVACGLSQLDPEQLRAAGDSLAKCGVFCDDGSLAFRHPIQRAAIYAGMTRSDRADSHRRAADLLARRSATPEQVAAHLLLCDPQAEAQAVENLRRAAAAALARGAPDVAATYLRRALAEPPDPAIRSEVLMELCIAEARSPEPSSLESLRLGLDLIEDPRKRAEVTLEVAQSLAMVADMKAALGLLDQAVHELGDRDQALSLRLQAEYISIARLDPATHDEAMQRLRALRPAALPSSLAGSILLANLAMERVEDCNLAAAVEVARRAVSDDTLLDHERWMLAYAANALVWADRTEEAEHLWTAVFQRAHRRGSVTMLHLAAIWRSHLLLRCGAVNGAEADARVGLNVCRERAWRYSRSYAVAFLVDALVERAEVAEAERVVAENPSPFDLHYQLFSVGALRCAQGRFTEGLDLFLRCGANLAAQGADRNPSVIPWRSRAALAAQQLGEGERARALAEEEVVLASAFGAPRALGAALRARALVGEASHQIPGLEEAVAVLSRSPARLEHARALADLGSALRRGGRRSEAEVHLRDALERAHRCGGTAVRDRVRDELLCSGLRPRRFAATGADALTPSESRVADLAVAGLSNRNIAQSLFVSLKTVEAHLSSVYRKLGVSSRWQLLDVWTTNRRSGPITG